MSGRWPLVCRRLEITGRSTVVRPLRAPQVLSVLARDAVDLFASPLAARIRVCAAADCGLLYLEWELVAGGWPPG